MQPKPDNVSGSDGENVSVKGHPDNNTTSRSVHGNSDTSSSNGGSNSASSSNSSNHSSQGNSGNALTRLFNLNLIFDYEAS